jgi:DNA polymerase-3 subunit beta
MKAVCLKNHLKEAIGLCERITGKNLSLPILNNVLISSEDNRTLKFTATNLELGIEVEIPAKVEKKGKLAVPAGIVNNFLINFSGDENITFESQDDNLLISTTNSSTLIKGQPSEDFPILPKLKDNKSVSLEVGDLIMGFKSVWYAASVSNIKPEIASVYICSGKNNPITFVATDSFRLAEKKGKKEFIDMTPMLIPFKAVSEILRIFEDKEGEIKIISDRNQINIETKNIKFISRLTEGVFPDYQQIIPKKFATDVIVDKNVFTNALKTASIFSGKLNELNIAVKEEADIITLKSASADVGEHTNKIAAKVTGEEIKMTFNHRYVFDCLTSISSHKIILRFVGEGKPLLISGTEDTSFQYLVMPMNTL